MALEKAIDTPYGAKATYWRIAKYEVDLDTNSINFDTSGYLDANARNANATPLAMQRLGFVMQKPPEQLGRADMYAAAKAQDAFTGSKDA